MSAYFRLSKNKDGIARVVFDHREEKINTLSTPLMEELEALLDRIRRDSAVKILVFQSGKPDVFIAGADLKEVAEIKNEDEARNKSARGQRVLDKIKSLPFPSVAVIDGACLGGGLELALACAFRVVSDNKKTRLGLPEVTLGIIPGFGGTRRLPRLIGLRRALPMVLSGKAVDGPRAFKMKLADALYRSDSLEEKTAEFIRLVLTPAGRKKIMAARRKRFSFGSLLGENPITRAVIFAAAKKTVLKKTRGLYPAPLAALKVIQRTCRGPEGRALKTESRAFAGLAVSPTAKNLIRLFFTGEALKKEYLPPQAAARQEIPPGGTRKQVLLPGGRQQPLRHKSHRGKKESPPLKTAAVLGAGTMGGGIAWLFSNAGVSVVMKDINRQAVGSAYAAVHTIYDTLVRIGKINRREADMKAQKVSGTTDYRGFGRADFIIEAIVEDKKIKTDALAELETFCRPDAIIATNTSSLSVDELARGLEHPERFLGFHFFNPVSRMPLVEVVRGGKTSAGTLARAVRYARELGKTPIVVKDCHGFLVNRILMSYLNEALFLLQEGYDFSKVDRLMLNFGMPMGPFALLDEIGIRVALKVAHILSSAYPERSPGVALAAEMEADKSLGGRQAGRGFYLYEGKKRRPNPAVGNILKRQDIRLVGRFDADEVRERLLLRMINEAALCLEQKIIEKPAYLDLALILGTGFPAFRGGILRYADSLGTGTVLSLTERYAERAGGRFVPGALIRELAGKERGFYA